MTSRTRTTSSPQEISALLRVGTSIDSNQPSVGSGSSELFITAGKDVLAIDFSDPFPVLVKVPAFSSGQFLDHPDEFGYGP